jgi:pimeloyl-ACP methyl ester carboxylesterase
VTRVVAAAAAALLLPLVSGCGASPHARQTSPRLHCSGRGAPTVVFEAGLGATHAAWSAVQPVVARSVRACSYDRLRAQRRNASDDAADLHRLLTRADVRPPLVLVGHSFGGILARLYAARYPRDLAGVVLVDSSSPQQVKRLLAALGRRKRNEPAVATELRAFLQTNHPNPEGIDVRAAFAAARRARGLPPVPLIVVQAGRENSPSLPLPLKAALDSAWYELQAQLATLSPRHVHVVAATSGHDVPRDQPDVVAAAVVEVARAARTGGRLRPCARVFERAAAQCVSG